MIYALILLFIVCFAGSFMGACTADIFIINRLYKKMLLADKEESSKKKGLHRVK